MKLCNFAINLFLDLLLNSAQIHRIVHTAIIVRGLCLWLYWMFEQIGTSVGAEFVEEGKAEVLLRGGQGGFQGGGGRGQA